MNELAPITIEPEGRADASIILMHGLGADGHDFEPLVPELDLPSSLHLRWVFPQAPVRQVTVNGGMAMRAWYDIEGMDPQAAEDEPGIRESARFIEELIRADRDNGIPAKRIVLAGFSQGGAMALHVALRWPERICGIAALSCYLPLGSLLAAEASPAINGLPVFMAHGTSDPVVALAMAETARDALRSRGCAVDWHTYPMGHGVCEKEVADLRAWILLALRTAG
jgi:phospholipase/carboxylesterase